MSTASNDGIMLCQPDNIKGCSLCCGLFNFSDISSDPLSRFLNEGESRERTFSSYEIFKIPAAVRDKFSHICPFQGFLKDNKPGCLIHPLSSGVEGRDRSLFASRICDNFFCPAHTILSEEEKKFLIENVPDWYLYSAAIADPESYSFIYNYVKANWADSEFCAVLINEGLTVHALNLAANNGVIFCYSIPEYNINRENFCISYNKEARDMVISRIISLSSALI